MRFLFSFFYLSITGILNAQDSLAYVPRQTLDLCADTCENQKLGAFEISIKRRDRSSWGEDHRIVLSRYNEKTDTLWPRKTNLMRYRDMWYVKNMWLFEKETLIMIMMDTGGGTIYMAYKWKGHFWDLTSAHLVGTVLIGYNSSDITIQAINYNRLVAIQGNKKELIEYDLTAKTEKRTEIKE